MIIKTAVQQQWHQQWNTDEIPVKSAEILAKALVDDEIWYTVKCTKEVGDWVRAQPNHHWYNHIDRQWIHYHSIFDMHHELYAYLKLSWGVE